MRVVFMGTPEFAVPSLSRVARDHEVIAVYTREDKPSGRGREPSASPVKARAQELGIPVEQPATLRDPSAQSRLAALAPDLIAVAAYGLILPPEVLAIPALGCINVHASLLPRWRGAAPVQRAILAGDQTTGVSIMRMEEGLDTGPYAAQVEDPMDDKSAVELTDELAGIGAETLSSVLEAIAAGTATWTAQDDSVATYADKVTAADVALDPLLAVATALRRVRASTRSAPCRAVLGGTPIVVRRATLGPPDVDPGRALCEGGIVLGVRDGSVRLEELVPQGKAPMSAAAFSRGARLGAECGWTGA
jgi:methionyl-tRNA formyltransferase